MSKVIQPALPFEKESSVLRYALSPLIGLGKSGLRGSSRANKYVSKWINPEGIAHADVNRALRGIPEARRISAITPDPVIDASKWYNKGPVKWFTRGEEGLNTIGARMVQGGLFGKGGLVRGPLAVNPKFFQHMSDLRSAGGGSALRGFFNPIQNNKMLRPHIAEGGAWYSPQSWRVGTRAGLIGRGTTQGVKAGLVGGLGLGIPAYDVLSPDERDERGVGQRLGGALGEVAGSFASWPMGALSWGPSTAASVYSIFNPENETSRYIAENINPWTPARIAGEFIGSGGRPKDPPKPLTQEEYMRMQQEEYQRQMMMYRRMQMAQRGYMTQPSLPPHLQARYYLQDPRYSAYIRNIGLAGPRMVH